jgi:hypothetical protein
MKIIKMSIPQLWLHLRNFGPKYLWLLRCIIGAIWIDLHASWPTGVTFLADGDCMKSFSLDGYTYGVYGEGLIMLIPT